MKVRLCDESGIVDGFFSTNYKKFLEPGQPYVVKFAQFMDAGDRLRVELMSYKIVLTKKQGLIH